VVATDMRARHPRRFRRRHHLVRAAAVVGALSILGGSAVAEAPHLTMRAAVEGSGYTDTDHVTVASPTIAASVEDKVAGWAVGGRYLVDAVSAASVDIVSSATARWHEIRHVGSGSVRYKPGDLGAEIAGGVSREPDYLALGAGGTVMLDLAEKNLTLSAGYSFGDETAGRSGTPYTIFSRKLMKHTLQAGATIVLDPSSSLALSTDAVFERGNQAKPYRYIPMFAPGVGARLAPGASVDDVNALRSSLRPADELPLSRDRAAVSVRYARRLSWAALKLDERLYADDWGLKASTSDLRLLVDLGRALIVWPHLRAHIQTPVDFWRRTYELSVRADGAIAVPDLRTGDRELGPLTSTTVGGGLRCKLPDAGGALWSITVQGDAVHTRYLDALYITRRWAYFLALSLDAQID
jgi:hypothetical protein